MKPWHKRLVAAFLVAIGFSLTVVLAYIGGSSQQASAATSALLAILSGIFQLLGAAQFHSLGKADPGLARASVRRLYKMTLRANKSRKIAEENFNQTSLAQMRRAVGEMSVDLSWIEEGLLDSIDDWREFHHEALKGIEQDASSQDREEVDL